MINSLLGIGICPLITKVGNWNRLSTLKALRKICEIYEGTKEIQKNTIASALIGKLK